jgi:hypothetical protein
MKHRIFSFALGNIWRWTRSKNVGVLVDYLKQLDISGVEITFASKEELYFFELSEDNASFLSTLDYVSIHAPFRLISGSESQEELFRQLNIMSRLYKDVKAQNIIIHPDELPGPEILKSYSFTVSTENLPAGGQSTVSGLSNMFTLYPDLGLCIDVSHAYLRSGSETEELVGAFNDRISQVHFSGTYKNMDHQSLRNVTKAFLDSIEPVKTLHVPIVIEEDMEETSLEYVKEEIKCIKNIF